MPRTYLIFDFGGDEAAAQQARHRIEGWKQGFRLGNKLLLKFERTEQPGADNGRPAEAKSKKSSASDSTGRIRVLVRLDFSDHEKLSFTRWQERIPTEEPFKSAKAEDVPRADARFAKTEELFDSLD